jgi:Glycosyl transferase 4-like domain
VRILIVSWAWPPIGRIGSLRPLGMAREWTRLGHEVHILTGPGDRGGEYAPDLVPRAEDSGAVVHRADAPGIPKPERLRAAFEGTVGEATASRQVSRLRQIVSQWKSFPDLQRSWIGPARARALAIHQETPFGVVWSTSPPESAHYVAGALAEGGVRWVADFRDQWSDYLLARWDPLSRWIVDRITRRVLKTAAHVSAATEGVAASLRRASGRPVTCVRNGFDPVLRSNAPVRERCLGYFGRIDPLFQHPERLWAPLRVSRDRGRPWTVEFYAAPGGGGGAAIDVPDDLEALVRVLPPLAHPDALRAMQAMTALLVLAWETRGGETAVAGKLYEYVGSGRPMLVCAPSGFEARTLVEQTGTGIGAWGDAEIDAALSMLETFAPDAEERAGLTREHSARLLLEILSGPAPP